MNMIKIGIINRFRNPVINLLTKTMLSLFTFLAIAFAYTEDSPKMLDSSQATPPEIKEAATEKPVGALVFEESCTEIVPVNNASGEKVTCSKTSSSKTDSKGDTNTTKE